MPFLLQRQYQAKLNSTNAWRLPVVFLEKYSSHDGYLQAISPAREMALPLRLNECLDCLELSTRHPFLGAGQFPLAWQS